MRDPIDRLIAEHQALMARFAELARAMDDLARRGEDALAETRPTLESVSRVMTTALLAHARKEDEALFPALEAALETHGGPTAAMREEHDAIHERAELFRRTLHELNEIEHPAIVARGRELQGLARRDASVESLRTTGQAILDLVEAHFAKEEQILFPMAREILPARTLAEVSDRMDEIDLSSAV